MSDFRNENHMLNVLYSKNRYSTWTMPQLNNSPEKPLDTLSAEKKQGYLDVNLKYACRNAGVLTAK